MIEVCFWIELCLFAVMMGITNHVIQRVKTERDGAEQQRDRYKQYLSTLIRASQLDTLNPYVESPGFEESRCWFCVAPKEMGHSDECLWVKMFPVLTDVIGVERQKNVDTGRVVTEAGRAVGIGDEGCR